MSSGRHCVRTWIVTSSGTRSSSTSWRTKSKSGWLADGKPTSISLKPISTSVLNMVSLRAGSIGSISAWLPSRRSTEHHTGASSIRRLGQVRSSSASGSGRNGRYFSNGMGFGVTGSGGMADPSRVSGGDTSSVGQKTEKPPGPDGRRRRGEHLCAVFALHKEEAGDGAAHRFNLPDIATTRQGVARSPALGDASRPRHRPRSEARRRRRHMSDIDLDEFGPVDYAVIEFPADRPPDGSALPFLIDLQQQGIIRVLDLAFVQKDADGSTMGIDISDVGLKGDFDVTMFAHASSGLVDGGDLDEAGAALEPGCSAAVLVYENTWAAPFARALRRNGAQLVAGGRIPVQAILAKLDSLDAATSGNDRIAALRELADLKAQGVLTQAEFEAEKARLLASS